ncbi:tRNA pseudouridine(38-40) synthase TruA [Clostridium thermosuccinogenes]|uniref:tRNA pseudouridine synthase A n=1 Tax=Clostridium thermosuccinogenes TaxID=84032 RepID=A0A2K2F9I4_9CLOT|nr:tRNA pseudouridine(38-40) synthase TruA [Pseudoclostridium thermosuccinogenes]AUS98111.1 tRNA pseudouridine(38-40) synthase TruA [Pseudoclostridium thermosuccinogenes]PNT95418.1 tRNA pseudouridine(38-40) synthase TruA [Pseudoclostridium thermosuccinogenes]PNT96594.1 tRNA pseudouridine(38-40) synthase TruA [Pseudoclostridium thermosuccinogenes]
MRNIKLTIEYDGTNYHGWQSQTNAVTVQDVVKRAIESLTGEDCDLVGSSRTDVGVHALGQVANFHTNSGIPGEKFAYALNNLLPEDIVIRESEDVSPDFHARFSSKGKKYRYLIYNSRKPSALLRNRAALVHLPLDIEAMQKALPYFLGRHDFSAFRASGSDTKTSERTITGISISENSNALPGPCSKDSKLIELEVSGDGFLYNMVRIIAGTLIYVGNGKIKYDDIPAIIESRDRRRAGQTAPAHGLYLVEVYF